MIFVGKSYRSRDKMLKVTFAQTTRVLKGHLMKTGGIIAQWFPHLLLHPAAPGSIPSITYFFQRKELLMFLINFAASRKVVSGLIMLMEPI